jgi:hypothetical protein
LEISTAATHPAGITRQPRLVATATVLEILAMASSLAPTSWLSIGCDGFGRVALLFRPWESGRTAADMPALIAKRRPSRRRAMLGATCRAAWVRGSPRWRQLAGSSDPHVILVGYFVGSGGDGDSWLLTAYDATAITAQAGCGGGPSPEKTRTGWDRTNDRFRANCATDSVHRVGRCV